MPTLRFRPAGPADLPALLDLERSAADIAWPAGAFEQELALPQAEVWLAWLEDDPPGAPPAGFVDFWVVAGEVSLMNVAVAPRARRRGVGAALLAWMDARARERGGETTFLEVRAGNAAALALYRKLGFQQVGIRKRYYHDSGEDAVVMARPVDAAPGPR